MKSTFATMLFLVPILFGAAWDENTPPTANGIETAITETTETTESMSDTLVVKIGTKQYSATLLDSPTATAFKAMLPLTMNMTELNGNEKYFDLSKNLPTNASNPGIINAGDLLLYGPKTLVLFYKTFSTSYSYTKLGKISDPTGLAAALGPDRVVVTVELR
ncbi:MAG TPA: cyclophilin-like fold protein [Chryseolinea sp.]